MAAWRQTEIGTLYFNDPTFGHPADYIAAFLWGFGLHNLTSVTVETVAQKMGSEELKSLYPP